MARVSLHSAYVQISFSTEANLLITDTQGIDCIEELKIITDREIENMCKFISRSGGINPITNVYNLGLQVSLISENEGWR